MVKFCEYLSQHSRNCAIHMVKLTNFICKYYFSLQLNLIWSQAVDSVHATLLYNTVSTGCQHSNWWEGRGSNDAENVEETGNKGSWQSSCRKPWSTKCCQANDYGYLYWHNTWTIKFKMLLGVWPWIMTGHCWAEIHSCVLMTGATGHSEMWVHLNLTTQYHIPGDGKLHSHSHDNLKSHIITWSVICTQGIPFMLESATIKKQAAETLNQIIHKCFHNCM
jgi:hypothetical protein